MAGELLQETEKQAPLWSQERTVLNSYKKLVFPVNASEEPFFTSAPLNVLLDYPSEKSVEAFRIPWGDLFVCRDKHSLSAINEHWQDLETNIRIHGPAVVVRVASTVDEDDHLTLLEYQAGLKKLKGPYELVTPATRDRMFTIKLKQKKQKK